MFTQREIVDALKSQLSALKEHLRAQDEAIKRQGTLQSAMDQSRNDHAAAMERMVVEFAKVTAETDALRAQLAQANLEVAALRTKVGAPLVAFRLQPTAHSLTRLKISSGRIGQEDTGNPGCLGAFSRSRAFKSACECPFSV